MGKLAKQHLGYENLFRDRSDQVLDEVCAGKISLRRFQIVSPRDNSTTDEPFKFSSRHSEFINFKAEAILPPKSNSSSLKVVVEYPEKSNYADQSLQTHSFSTASLTNQISQQDELNLKPKESKTSEPCEFSQTVELMQ